jgi:cell division protease FtsH
LIKRSYERARVVLTEHLDVLHKLAEALIEKETILGAEMDDIIRQVRPDIELPETHADKEEKQKEETAQENPENKNTAAPPEPENQNPSQKAQGSDTMPDE